MGRHARSSTRPPTCSPCTARYVDAGCDVISTNTWGLPSALRHDGPRLWGTTRAGALDGRRAARPAARAPAVARGRPRGRVRGRVQPQRRRRHARGPRTRSSCSRALFARRAARPDPARDARRSCATSTYATVEALLATGLPVWLELPPLPARRVRRLRPALGRPGGRRVRARRAPLRGAGRRARCSSTASRPTTSRASCRGCATSPTCRSASTPTSATSPTTAGASRPASAARSSPRWRGAGARRERRSSAAAAASGPSTSPPRGARSTAPRPGTPPRPRRRRERSRPRGPRRRAAHAAGPTSAGATCSRSRSPTSICEPGVFVPTQGSFLVWRHLFRDGHRAPASAASTSAAAPGC